MIATGGCGSKNFLRKIYLAGSYILQIFKYSALFLLPITFPRGIYSFLQQNPFAMQKSFAWAAVCCLSVSLFSCNNASNSTPAKDTTAAAAEAPKPPAPAEFADMKYAEIGKKQMAALASNDMKVYAEGYADSAVFQWSSGDSVVGKEAIVKYWTNRRTNVIDSLQLDNDIWLPIKVNQPQKGPDMPGVWLLSWMRSHVKYKKGKPLVFWVHTDYHFNSADKIDRAIQYIDRAPINRELGIK